MRYFTKLILVIFLVSTAHGQVKMRPVSELVSNDTSTWNRIKELIRESKNAVEVLPKIRGKADSALYQSQITTRSPLGAIIYQTGGIMVDSGWIRILGSGSSRLDRDVMNWNKGKSYINLGEQPSFLLVADDVLGGFFSINAGGIDSAGKGKIFYLGPDDLRWTNTNMSYSDFLTFCFTGNLNAYYKGLRWSHWKKDVAQLNGNAGYTFFPFLWSKEGQKDINKDNKKEVSIQELWEQYFDQQKK